MQEFLTPWEEKGKSYKRFVITEWSYSCHVHVCYAAALGYWRVWVYRSHKPWYEPQVTFKTKDKALAYADQLALESGYILVD